MISLMIVEKILNVDKNGEGGLKKGPAPKRRVQGQQSRLIAANCIGGEGRSRTATVAFRETKHLTSVVI
jgi:hypothetical protein